MRQSTIEFQNDMLHLGIEPELGALVSFLSWTTDSQSRDILYSPQVPSIDGNGIHRYGCWPLIPFANRCEGGRLIVGSDIALLPLNDPEQNRTMHGCGWKRPWAIEALQDASCSLRQRCDDFGPYRYDARLDIALRPNHVHFALTARNTGPVSLPFGLGFHPWFPCTPETTIEVGARRCAVFGENFAVVGAEDVSGETDFRAKRSVWRDQELAVNFLDWAGPATITYPASHRIHILASQTLRAPLLWRPAGADFICFEPQSHAIGAPGQHGAQRIMPLTMIEPGQIMMGWMEFRVEPDP